MTKKEELIAKAEALEAQRKSLEEENRILHDQFVALQEEKQKLLDDAKASIDYACLDKFFCGVILDANQLSAIVKLAIQTGEPVSIAYQLYPTEDVVIKQPDTITEDPSEQEPETPATQTEIQ